MSVDYKLYAIEKGKTVKLKSSTSSVPGPSGINPYSYQPALATRATKRGWGKSRWVPTFSTSTLTLQKQKPPGVRSQEVGLVSDNVMTHTPPQEWRKSIEVCKWNEQEKGWKKVSNLPVVLTDATTNVMCVAQMVADDYFNGEDAVLLDIDYLKIPDTPSTKGEESASLSLASCHRYYT